MARQFYCKFQLLWQTNFYLQGLTLVSRCSQRSEAWLPAAGTPLLQGRPGRGHRPVIGPAAKIAWCGGTTRRHSKGDGPNLDLTQAQSRTQREVLRGERPKWLFVHFGHSKWTPAERPWKGAGFCRGNWRSKFFFLRKRRKHTASSFSYSSMAMSTPLTCTPSWARIKMYFTPSMTRVDTRSLCSAGSRTVTSAAATSTCLG